MTLGVRWVPGGLVVLLYPSLQKVLGVPKIQPSQGSRGGLVVLESLTVLGNPDLLSVLGSQIHLYPL